MRPQTKRRGYRISPPGSLTAPPVLFCPGRCGPNATLPTLSDSKRWGRQRNRWGGAITAHFGRGPFSGQTQPGGEGVCGRSLRTRWGSAMTALSLPVASKLKTRRSRPLAPRAFPLEMMVCCHSTETSQMKWSHRPQLCPTLRTPAPGLASQDSVLLLVPAATDPSRLSGSKRPHGFWPEMVQLEGHL